MELRRIVTGHDRAGAPIIVSDGLAEASILGPSTLNLWYAEKHPAGTYGDGQEPPDRKDFVPPPGGVSWRFLRLPPRGGKPAGPTHDPRFDTERLGFHATDTIDFIEIISGRILLELNNHSVELGPGNCVIQRGTWHRWIVVGDEPCVFSAIMLAANGGDDPGFAGASTGTTGPRRVVTDGDGVCADGPPATVFRSGHGLVTAELWHTFAPVASPLQGGDAPQEKMQLNPPGGGITWKQLTIPASMADQAALMHRTPTIDLVRIAGGTVDLELPGQSPVPLTAGDCVIQRGTEHAWRNTGDGPLTLSAVMIGVGTMADEPDQDGSRASAWNDRDGNDG
ncbi:cupin domain-containing protein [Candidatus Poriferisocius sp.]|uniref:cupin domain-containing protein n=1 Tax=Candidatus Poriferisocius sp. TaxID=3101276 RepID=UPI003B01E305